MNTYIKLEWWNECDLAETLYSEGLHNVLYIDGDAARAEYLVEEEGTESITGVFTPDLQSWTKRVQIDFPAAEFLIDALHHAALCDTVYYYDKFGGVFQVYNLSVQHEFLEGDCLAIVTVSFDIAGIIKTVCANMTIGSDV